MLLITLRFIQKFAQNPGFDSCLHFIKHSKRILIMKNILRQLQLIFITTERYLNKEMGFLRLPLLLITTFSVRIKYIRNITFLYFLDMHIIHISRN